MLKQSFSKAHKSTQSRRDRSSTGHVITITPPREEFPDNPRITFARRTLKFSCGRKNSAPYISAVHGTARLALSRNYRRKLYRSLPRIFHAVDGKPCVNAVLLVRANLWAMLLGARCAPLFREPPPFRLSHDSHDLSKWVHVMAL